MARGAIGADARGVDGPRHALQLYHARRMISRTIEHPGRPPMSLSVRRVVTGHDKNGRAIVTIDETAKNAAQTRPGANAAVIWTSEGFPVDNDGDADTSGRKVGTTLANGTVFRVVSFGPGVAPRNHRTDSIDYAVVMAGEIDMELDDRKSVHLKAGDVLVQRGTIHNWVNKGTAPCVIAFTLVAAKPVSAGGKVLNAVG
jgi:quercetin dioxygenase-like cupin family protein